MDEFFDALAEVQSTRGGVEGFAIRDVMRDRSVCAHRARAMVKQLMDVGRAEFAGRRLVQRMDGSRSQIPVYRLVKGKRKAL